ncbi:MAG: hypothetical protein ABEN55_10650, partial [Bradymonadaceae bacterium]
MFTCWGDDYTPDFAKDAPMVSFTSITVTIQHACGIEPSGDVRCWGKVSTSDPAGAFRTVDAASPFDNMGQRRFYACGIHRDSRALECWGRKDLIHGVWFSILKAG